MATSTKRATKSAPKQQNNASAGAAQNDGMLLEFFTDGIKDTYWAEKNLLKTLPKMAKAATSEELARAFLDHAEMTKVQIGRLDEIFAILGKKPQAKKCEAMEGIIAEGESIIEDTEEGTSTRDVGLIMAGQKAEHYEIASYGGLAQLATTLGLDDIAALLQETLQEEKDTDLLLTDIAENNINYEAAEEGDGEED